MTRLRSRTHHTTLRLDDRRLQSQWRAIDTRLNQRTGRPRLRLAWAVPMLAGLAGVAALLIHFGSATPKEIEAGAEPREVALDDGSTIIVAPGGRVRARGSAGERGASVLRGTAEFDVAHDPAHPFVVRVAAWSVRVLGTRFSVAMTADGTHARVVVSRGLVEVSGSDMESVRLAAGSRWSSDDRNQDAPRPTTVVAAAPIPAGTPGVEPERRVDTPMSSAKALPQAIGIRVASSHAVPSARTSGRSMAAGTPAPTSVPTSMPAPSAAPAATQPPLPPGARDIFARAESARAHGDARAAAALLREILRRFPGDPRTGLAAFELAKVLMDDLGDARAALPVLDEALTSAPDASFREHALARKVQALSAVADHAACRAAQRDYLARYPQGVHAAVVHGSCRE